MSRRKMWIMGGVGVAVLGAVITGVVGVRAARAGTPDKPGAGFLPPELQERPFGRMLAHNLGRLRELRGELQVTPEQRREIATVLQAHREEIGNVVREVRDGHRKLREAAAAEPLDEAAVRRAAAGLAGPLGDAAVLHAKVRREVFAQLTPEQVKKIESFRHEVAESAGKALDAATKQ